MEDNSLKNKALRGAGWSFIDSISGQGLSFLVGIILARLLSPSEYGLIGIIMIFIAISNSVVDSGFSSALIRKKDADELDLSTGFFTNLIISIFLFLLLFSLAPFFSSFFQEPQLIPLIRVMGLSIVINAFCLIQRTVLVKAIDFKTQTFASVFSSLVSGILGIVMAVKGFGVWSLVSQHLCRQLVNTSSLWFLSRWRPIFSFSISRFVKMWSYGWKLLVSGLIDTTWNEMYQVVIGKVYSPSALGLYTRSKQFTDIFSSNLTNTVQRVSFPVLSKMQDDREAMKDGYKKLIKLTVLITFSLMLGLSASAKPMILCLLGPKWIDCVTMIQIICFYKMLYPLHSINLNMLQVEGRSDLFLKLEVIKKIIALFPIFLGIFIGIYWMLCGSILTGIISYYINAYYSGKTMNYSFMEQVRDIMPALIISSIMAVCVYPICLLDMSPYVLFPVQVAVGVLIVVLLCRLFKLPEYFELCGFLHSFIKKF